MLYGILADIHANLPALDAVLGSMARLRVDHYLCLGDVVGYGPDPVECIDRLRLLSVDHIQGNHEARLLGLSTGRFNRVAEAAIQYSLGVLEDAELQFLRTFPVQLRKTDDILCVHGSPSDRDEYVFSVDRMQAAIDDGGTWVCLCGHTHQQYVYDEATLATGPLEKTLERDHRYLVNPGSVGQPRDGDPRAAFAVFDPEEGVLSLQRVQYDVEETAERIQRAGLPGYLADRLMVGR